MIGKAKINFIKVQLEMIKINNEQEEYLGNIIRFTLFTKHR